MSIGNPEDWAENIVDWRTGKPLAPKSQEPTSYGENTYNIGSVKKKFFDALPEKVYKKYLAKEIDEMWPQKFDGQTLEEVMDGEWPALKEAIDGNFLREADNFLPENKNNPLVDDTYNLEFLEID